MGDIKKTSAEENVPVWSKNILVHYNMEGNLQILDLDNDAFFYSLDKMSARFAALIDGKTAIKELVKKMSAEYKIDENRFLKHSVTLIEKLQQEKLIEFA